MKKKLFGLTVEEDKSTNIGDFKAYVGVENMPYGGNYFQDIAHMPVKNGDANRRITSIPSPYARMHLTDLAFEEVFTYQSNNIDLNKLSSDYLRAVSHCLDMFELFFRFDQLDLTEKGIKVERNELVTKRGTSKWDKFLKKNSDVAHYVETLDLFRERYMDVIKKRDETGLFKFIFADSYVFYKPNGDVFASTSPFTGFFTTSNCDLSELNIKVDAQNGQHNVLTNNANDWLTLSGRSLDFQNFMYILLNPEQNGGGLGNVFKDLFNVVKFCVGNRKAELDLKVFSQEYPRFNFSGGLLPRLDTKTADELVYVRSSEMDSSYLKFLLFFKVNNPIRFAIKKEYYGVKIKERHFPDDTSNVLPWIGVNDILSDALFVLPYELNTDYVSLSYTDDNKTKTSRRCLLPIKSSILKYLPDLLKQDEADKRIKIHKYNDGHFAVNVTVDVLTGENLRSPMVLCREYYPAKYDNQDNVNGRVYTPEEMENFAFGIYPFVRSETDLNIYKVLFYNQLKGSIDDKTDGNTDDKTEEQRNEERADINLTFFYKVKDQNDICCHYDKYKLDSGSPSCMNYTEQYNPDKNNSMNMLYYHIEDDQIGQNGIAFVELSVRDEDPTITKKIQGTALIVPLMKEPQTAQVAQGNERTRIAIDLGTSNTYIAYQHGNGAISEINMVDSNNNAELRFMHKTSEPRSFILKPRYAHDLCLQPAEGASAPKEKWTKCIASQLCEFIPTSIKENTAANMNIAFSFPIPTLISTLRRNGSTNVNVDVANNKPLVHSTIPFAYYEVGSRRYDAPKGDFKWFIDLVKYTPTQGGEKKNFQLFVSELLFIVRSHMLYMGYALDKCEIIWTYPLAFNSTLRKQSELIWQEQYLRNFRSDSSNYWNQPYNYNDITNLVRCTNESLSPFYYCVNTTNAQDAYQILMDIGGGSTDVIGYNQGAPLFISSFNFAGNDLYVEKSNQIASAQTNIIRKNIDAVCKNIGDKMSESDFAPQTQRIQTSDRLTSLMNYGFQKFPTEFNLIWNNLQMQFMLKFHLASIVYQTAQMCYCQNPDKLPYQLHLAGNGSKLFRLLDCEVEDFINQIFAKVYNRNDVKIFISNVGNPKFAAARGSLIGYDDLFGENAKNSTTKDKCYIALGDGCREHVVVKDSDYTINAEDKVAMRRSVVANVEKFIDMFFALSINKIKPIEKEEVLNYMKANTDNNTAIDLGNEMKNMFFEYIKDIMFGISNALCRK